MNRFFILIFVAIFAVSCNKNDELTPAAEVNKTAIAFSNEAENDSISLSVNTDWVIEKNASWLSLSPTAGSGNAVIKVSVGENAGFEVLHAKITVKVSGIPDIEIAVSQDRSRETTGLYILSEGYFGTGTSDIAFYDVKNDVFTPKYFNQKNGRTLGDTGNDLALYGSKLYCVVSGSSGYEGHIEIINPQTGVSQKSVTITENGAVAMPRCITFYQNKAYITTFSNTVVRLDTAQLEIDGHAALSGTFAEGICHYNGKLYVCNSGQGSGTTVSVVDIASFSEERTLTVPQNPIAIAATSAGEIYFTTGDLSWNEGPASNLHILNATSGQVTKTFDVRASRIALNRDFVYAVDFDWGNYSDYICKINLKTQVVTDLADRIEDFTMIYNVSINPANNDVYITNTGQNVLVWNKNDEEQKRFETGVPSTSKVVAITR
ncbi:MAG: hypothetical protein LBD59_11840 [Prevotellaceae bacterium]|jgi:hypothetical protein|nr:hypothetical protein [Prevotellaceae bacterium]